MKSFTRFFWLLGFMSQGGLADFDYSCDDGQGREIGFATTSLFGFDNDPIFSLKDDSVGLDFTLVGSGFRLIEGAGQWQIVGPLQHSLYASYYASFTRVFGITDNVPGRLRYNDAHGKTIKVIEFLCKFRSGFHTGNK